MTLVGRRAECEFLEAVLNDAREGRSRAVVLRGEAGVGKTALLEFLVAAAEGWRVARTVGIESEMELAYSGLHQLCAPILQYVGELPAPQRDALSTVFGLRAGDPPDRFLVALATLTLLAEAAERQPLLCVVDDAHWLDAASAQVVVFVARRLLAERVALVGVARAGIGDHMFAGTSEFAINGLGDEDARSLLLSHVQGPIDAAVCQQVIIESHGNPLALIELGRAANVVDFAGGFGMPASSSGTASSGVTGKIERAYAQRLHPLDADTRLGVLLAAAEPQGDLVVLSRAAEILGIGVADLSPAVDTGLIRLDARVEFVHPLARSVAYHSADRADRQLVHTALAEATDQKRDPDRRAWHRSRATPVPDDDIADELEQSAGRAQARGGATAAAAFLQRAFELTPEPNRRAQRALAAAQACLTAGRLQAADELLTIAESSELDGPGRARALLLRGHLAAVVTDRHAPRLLLNAARQLEPVDLELARDAYLTAYGAAFHAGYLGEEGVLLEICRAIGHLAPKGPEDAKTLYLEGLARMYIHGLADATPVFERATALLAHLPDDDVIRWGWTAATAANSTWDSDAKTALHERGLEILRKAGALAELPSFLSGLAKDRALNGDLIGARLLIAESENVASATGSAIAPFGNLRILALEGNEAIASASIAAAIEYAEARGQGLVVRDAQWAAAVLYNGLARYDKALAAARSVTESDIHLYPQIWALPELIEAATRMEETEAAREALDRFLATMTASRTNWAVGVRARSRALLSEGCIADRLYREAVESYGKTGLRPDLGRTHLLYGEWLRREGRRVEAREELRAAHEIFADVGMEAFAGRAQRELAATGEHVRHREPSTRDQLTEQEEQIAQLARGGLSNREIAGTLYLSSRTVEWHLRKVFMKLDITSRRQLRTALAARVGAAHRQTAHPSGARSGSTECQPSRLA